jgi:hypothetical protein
MLLAAAFIGRSRVIEKGREERSGTKGSGMCHRRLLSAT